MGAIPQDINDLRTLIQDNPQQVDRVDEVERLVERKLDEFAKTM